MRRIHVFPNWLDTNPYLNMLYLGPRADGWQIEGSTVLAGLVKSLAGLHAGDILHLHWTAPICERQPTESAAAESLDRFRGSVDSALNRGVRLVWTVHNKLTHDARYAQLEVALAEYLSDRAHRIIQLSQGTREAVSDLYELPRRKLVTLRHASYKGIYPQAPRQAEARAVLGVPAAEPVLGFVGQIQPYKGIETLLDAAALLAQELEGLTVLLAGRASSPEYLHGLTKRVGTGLRVLVHGQFVPDSDIGVWFSAADLMVFPYRQILNSGSLLLSATFGRPCVLPAEPHLVAQYGSLDWVSFFRPQPDPVESLRLAARSALEGAVRGRPSALAYAAEYTTVDMTQDFVRILADLEDPTIVAAGGTS